MQKTFIIIALCVLSACNHHTYQEPAENAQSAKIKSGKVSYTRLLADQSAEQEEMRFYFEQIDGQRAPEGAWLKRKEFSLPPGPVSLMIKAHPFDGIFTSGYHGLVALNFDVRADERYEVTGRYITDAEMVEVWVQDAKEKVVSNKDTAPLQGGPDQQPTMIPIFIPTR